MQNKTKKPMAAINVINTEKISRTLRNSRLVSRIKRGTKDGGAAEKGSEENGGASPKGDELHHHRSKSVEAKGANVGDHHHSQRSPNLRQKEKHTPSPPSISFLELPVPQIFGEHDASQKEDHHHHRRKKVAQITSPLLALENDGGGGHTPHSEDKPSVIVVTRPGLTEKKTTYFYYTPTLWEQMKASPCLDILRASYHKYGVKHVVLFAVLVAYSFFGAGLFLFLEQKAELTRMDGLKSKLTEARGAVVDETMYEMFNDSQRFLFFISNDQTVEIVKILQAKFQKYEHAVTRENFEHSIYSDMHWDFWNSMLYAWTIITTIGYGYLHPTTDVGKVFTMIYAIFGIPLFLSVLNDLGKVLTKLMKYPFFLLKKYARRCFQYCTRMSRDQIKEAEAKDLARLEVFDLPIPIAVGIVIGWIFLCSAITLTWETEWDYLIAFYFFFVSLSTIGFGDVMPKDSKFLLIMFGNIFIGLALVSMCINLIQAKFEKTYQATNSSTNESQGERQGDRSADESTDETSDAGGLAHQKSSTSRQQQQQQQQNYKRSSQMSLSGTVSRQMSQTSLPNYETSASTPPPPPTAGGTSDDEMPPPAAPRQQQTMKKYFAGKTTASPVLSKKLSGGGGSVSPTPSEPSKTVDTQTMLSIPYYQRETAAQNDRQVCEQRRDRVINVSNQRGTVRTLPSTTSFNEIDRIVDLNISAELLRNELIDIENYHHVLSPQEVIAQINHERQLKAVADL